MLGDLECFQHFPRSVKLKQHIDPLIHKTRQSFTKNTTQTYPDDAEFTAKPERKAWRLCPVSQNFFVSFQRRYRTVTADGTLRTFNLHSAGRRAAVCFLPSNLWKIPPISYKRLPFILHLQITWGIIRLLTYWPQIPQHQAPVRGSSGGRPGQRSSGKHE